MNNSLKAGIISGLIAGIISAIVYEIFSNIAVLIGLYDPWLHPLVLGNIVVNIPLFGFWGIILGIIYSRIYDIIPRKGVLKGLIYGLFLYFIVGIRLDTFLLPYGLFLWAAGDAFSEFFMWILYGLVLGYLFELLHIKYNIPKELKKIVQYDMMSGIFPGAIAGFFGGLAASFFAVLGSLTGSWGYIIECEVISVIDLWISQAGTHIVINMIWGTIFGALFAKVYNLVPGKKVIKGLCYGLIMFLITTLQFTTWAICMWANHNLWDLVLAEILGLSIGGANATIFGLVLGLLYRKPSK